MGPEGFFWRTVFYWGFARSMAGVSIDGWQEVLQPISATGDN